MQTYTKDSFGNIMKRYSLWYTRGSGHNTPVVNGFEQAPGIEFKAVNVICKSHADIASFSMNIEKAYPNETGIKYLKREIIFDRNPGKVQLIMSDTFELETKISEILINMYSPAEVSMPEKGLVIFNGKAGMYYDQDKCEVEISNIDMNDPKMEMSWGKSLRKIIFRYSGYVKNVLMKQT